MSEIIILVLEKCYDEQLQEFLETTDWIRKILDISKENSIYTFENGYTMKKGFMAFVRKISNKLVEAQKKSNEVSNFLDSLPEWTDYFNEDLS